MSPILSRRDLDFPRFERLCVDELSVLPLYADHDIDLAGLNRKMGQCGTVNTLFNFGEGSFAPDVILDARPEYF